MNPAFSSFSDEWQLVLQEFRASPHLCELKAFRELFICESRFRDDLASNFDSALRSEFSLLTYSDVFSLLPASFVDPVKTTPAPSNLNQLFLYILGLEQRYREFLKSLQPSFSSWRDWRSSQIKRLRRDDLSYRCTQITHIPFAIELTEGCSGSCHFCGLSAPSLTTNFLRFEQNAFLFQSILSELLVSAGSSALSACLYWATDPFDHPDYESYARVFRDVLGLWPITTSALSETQLVRLKDFIQLRSDGRDRPWGLRCSLRSKSAFHTLYSKLTHAERAPLVLIPQYPGSLSSQAVAGRSYRDAEVISQGYLGGTIACVSGFLISLPRQTISLITPCIAEPNHPNGYRTLKTVSFTPDTVKSQLNTLLSQFPCPFVGLNTSLSLTIDPSQFHLYSCKSCPDLLKIMPAEPFTLNLLYSLLPSDANFDEVLQCSLSMLQSGALNVVKL